MLLLSYHLYYNFPISVCVFVCVSVRTCPNPIYSLISQRILKLSTYLEPPWHSGCFKTIWVKIGAQTKKFLAYQLIFLVCLLVRLSVTESVCHTVCLSQSLSVTPRLDTSHSRRARETPPKAAISRVSSKLKLMEGIFSKIFLIFPNFFCFWAKLGRDVRTWRNILGR